MGKCAPVSNTLTHTHICRAWGTFIISAWGVCEYSVNTNYLRWWGWLTRIRCVCSVFLTQHFPGILPTFLRTRSIGNNICDLRLICSHTHRSHTQSQANKCYQINMNEWMNKCLGNEGVLSAFSRPSWPTLLTLSRSMSAMSPSGFKALLSYGEQVALHN